MLQRHILTMMMPLPTMSKFENLLMRVISLCFLDLIVCVKDCTKGTVWGIFTLDCELVLFENLSAYRRNQIGWCG
jgi:hypothetical protein